MAVQDGHRALRYLRRVRGRRRLGNRDAFDVFYRFYLVFLFVAFAVYYLSTVVEAREPGPSTDLYLTYGAAAAGLAVAAAIALGMRSGSRGGPLVLEPSDVHQILLAPIERRMALRGFAVRQLLGPVFWGMVAGGVLGLFALSELPGSVLSWVIAGAGLGAITATWGWGSAFVAAGLRLDGRLAAGAGAILIGLSASHLAGWMDFSPGAWQGRLALLPLRFDSIPLVTGGVAGIVCGVGIYRLNGLSVEAAARRSTLVPRLRLAMGFRDVRTVIELRRLLAGEAPRSRPLVRLGSIERLPPIWARDLQSLLRWPFSRFIRVALLGVGAGWASTVAWEHVPWLVVIAGVLMLVAALDAIEPLAQEIDHPQRSLSLIRSLPRLVLGHLFMTILLLLAVGAVGLIAAPAMAPDGISATLAVTTLVLVALASATAALLSVALEPPPLIKPSDYALPPEARAIPVLLRQVSRPSVALLGFLPLLAERYERTNPDIGAIVPLASLAPVVLIVGALRYAVKRLEREIRA